MGDDPNNTRDPQSVADTGQPNGNPRGCSSQFKLFCIGLISGYLLAAIGEGYAVSPGTFIGPSWGGLSGYLSVGL